MALYRISGNRAVEWKGEPINEVRHPLNIEMKWTEEQLNAIGLYIPAEADPIPAGKISVATEVRISGGIPKWVHTLETEPPLVVTNEDVNEHRTHRIEQGHMFSVTGLLEQIRVTGRPEDMDMLLALVITSQLRIAAGDTTETQYRDGNNVDHMLSPTQIIELWQLVVAWVEKAYKASWAIKAMDPIPQDYEIIFEDMLVA